MVQDEFVRKAISSKLSNQIEEMIIKIKESFGLTISKIQASKIVSWKAKSYNIQLNEKKLLSILGDKE